MRGHAPQHRDAFGTVGYHRFLYGTKAGTVKSRCKPGTFWLSGTDDRHLTAKTGTCPFCDQRLKQSLDTYVLLDKEAAGIARRCDLLRCMAPQFLLLIFLP